MELNKIYNEDCLNTMARMPEDFIDLVVTSPPYNMNLRIRNGEYCSRQIVEEFSTKYKGFADNFRIERFYRIHYKILKELLRVSKLIFYNISIVTGSKRAFFKLIGHFYEYLKDVIIWDKGHGQPAMSEGVLNRQSELILIFDKYNGIARKFNKCNFERGTMSDIWTIKKSRENIKGHNATYPEELPLKIISNFSNEGDIIYDPFMGSGTTAKAAIKLNRNWIGSEISSEYTELANKRLEPYINQLTLNI